MSFIDGSIKPKLVEQKIVDRVLKVQQENKPFKFDFSLIWSYLYNKILIKHMSSILIILFIVILLFYRYYDVKKKKKLQENRKPIEKDYNEEEYNEEYYSEDYSED